MYGVIILAAGNSKRMISNIPKVLHPLAGTPMLIRIIKSVLKLPAIKELVIVAGYHGDLLKTTCQQFISEPQHVERISWAHQAEPLGTADAVAVGLAKISKQINHVIVITGDLPLVSTDTLDKLISHTPITGLGVVTDYVDNPTGFGRIERDFQHNFSKIIEEQDASSQQKKIKEINVGLYLFPQQFLAKHLGEINNHNNQHEYYLTNIIEAAVTNKYAIVTIQPDNHLESFSVNSRKQLVQLERAFQVQQAMLFLEQGVTIIDPNRFDVRGEITIEQDVEIDINVVLIGKVLIQKGVKIGANCYIKDSIIKENVIIHSNSFIEGATIEPEAKIGPFARIRPNTHIGQYTKIGNFVEVKDSYINEHSKINHLSYVGNARIGNHVNIGAGTITCNYDGANKHTTMIKDYASIGASCQLIAPITVEEQATIAAGTTLMQNAPPYKLTLNKKIQYNIEWRRPDKKT
jgi:bifunctional UDP-N-acetylglucosamine pyrophosphorylase / glucosamine-1-phosphate N-acetyltransferase